MNPHPQVSSPSCISTKGTRPLLALFLFGLAISASFSNRAEALTLELYGAVQDNTMVIPEKYLNGAPIFTGEGESYREFYFLELFYYGKMADMEVGDFVRIVLDFYPSKDQLLQVGSGADRKDVYSPFVVQDTGILKNATFYDAAGNELGSDGSVYTSSYVDESLLKFDTLSGPYMYDFNFELDLIELTGIGSAMIPQLDSYLLGGGGVLTTKIFGGRYLDEGAQGWAGAAVSVPDSGSTIALLSLSLLGVVLVRRRVRLA
ncbi:VPDSG-CTERM sorting domain-containing protein [Pelagicoccus albus]|uniref:VPDSG-CTERM sorting domain-containing protein n=1 Tax=Pelagicoccus albus TaxID=415222 RepID=A0A7X1BAT8_9BACT|nr:VPDSG-CTERM sorting domain-containing protein [Pelagicoccus albus]MBC2607560.1 VPDSG-CTERM sorting domain-containing protein [Pelagicoccus albus]